MLNKENIEKINKYFYNKPIEKVYLFGSYARSEQKENSDIDIMLEFEKGSKISLIDFSRMKLDLEKILQIPVDLLTEDAISPYIRPFIMKDIFKIYEKSN